MTRISETAKRRAAAWTRVLASPPPPVTPFLDRQTEVGALRQFLAPGEPIEPVILQGAIGVGTTSVAAQLAVNLFPRFPGGILWADLTTVNGNPLPLLTSWAQTLGQPPAYLPDPAQRAHHLRQIMTQRAQTRGQILVVMDDARAVWLEGIQILRRALPDAATLILTTNESSVATMLEVDALPVAPWPDAVSVQLLFVGSQEALTDTSADEAASYARGIPLALSLLARAAAQAGAEPLLARLREPADELDVLRQEVADDAISRCLAANYALLEAQAPEDARLWRWLGVFAPGSFSVAEVAGVLASAGLIPPGESPTDVVDAALRRLAGWGLVELAPGWGFRLHPRLYLSAAVLLEHTEEWSAAQHAHRTTYLAYVLARRSRFIELETVRANALLGMDRAVEAVDHAAVRGYAWALSATRRNEEGFLWQHGYWHELRRRLEQARWAAEAEGEDWDVASFTGNLAILLQELGERENARRELERVRETFHRLGDVEQEIVALAQLSQLAKDDGDANAAREYRRQARILRQGHEEQTKGQS